MLPPVILPEADIPVVPSNVIAMYLSFYPIFIAMQV